MNINLLKLREEVRVYLASHPKPQTQLARETGVPHSWINKFCNGAFPNIRLDRFQRLIDWMNQDRAGGQRAADTEH
jgi:DNA-binding Xre family transcriptional regulator